MMNIIQIFIINYRLKYNKFILLNKYDISFTLIVFHVDISGKFVNDEHAQKI